MDWKQVNKVNKTVKVNKVNKNVKVNKVNRQGKATLFTVYSAFHAHVQLNVLYIYNNRKDNKELK